MPRTIDDPDGRLHKQPATQRSMKIAPILSDRLDDLVELVNAQGNLPGRVYRHDLLAAFIALAPETAAEIEELIMQYTDLRVRDAAVGKAKRSNVIELRPTKPGRRTSPS